MAEPVNAYEAFCNGQWLLEVREYRQAVIALERAKALEPDKASIREALGRAYLASRVLPAGRRRVRRRRRSRSPPTATPTTAWRAPSSRLGDPLARRHYRLAKCFGTGLE